MISTVPSIQVAIANLSTPEGADGKPVIAQNGPVTVTLDSGKTITIAAGASSGVLDGAVGNDVYQGPTTVTESIASASGGNLEAIAPNTAPVSTIVSDVNDTTIARAWFRHASVDIGRGSIHLQSVRTSP